jgi:hypothetical protein
MSWFSRPPGRSASTESCGSSWIFIADIAAIVVFGAAARLVDGVRPLIVSSILMIVAGLVAAGVVLVAIAVVDGRDLPGRARNAAHNGTDTGGH